jgi:chemotaxis protein MotB
MRRRRRSDSGLEAIWPGFTDALAGLVVALVFLLVLFFLFEVVLSRQVSGQESRIEALRGQIAELEAQLGASRAERRALADELEAARSEARGLEARLADREAALEEARERAEAARANLDVLSERVETLNRRLARIRKALGAAREGRAEAERAVDELRARVAEQEGRIAKQTARIEAMAGQIRNQLLERVERLERYRSEFFGRLRKVFARYPDIRIRGDRFVFQSEILFPSGEADLSAGGKEQLQRFVRVFRDLKAAIPEGIRPIILVEGFTDRVPIETAEFRSNWELSTARALSVVRYFIDQGLPPERLAAAGYGEHQPLTAGETPEQRRRNRRIEIKITNR